MDKQTMTQVSFEELWSELSGSTKFGQDELIEMLSVQDDDGKDFYIYHRHKAFCVPLHKIREFFTRHSKPIPPMTKDQELKYLREKVQELQSEAEDFQATGKVSRPATDESEVLEPVEEPVEPTDDSGSGDMRVEPDKPVPPQKDETIPLPHERKKQSLKEVRADLAKELKDVKNPKKKMTDKAVPQDVKGREAEVDSLLKKE
ncbi:MAG: hypothetical protein KAW52_00510 [candidate division Zixibacteria bacterium]|nr:hypothetical protein [candidate division Zixibacteria bacterium]